MTEFTINLTSIFAVMYAAFKVVSSVWICKREFQYPIWNSDGVQIPRGIHHKIQSLLRNFAINPEWGVLKLIAFAPVFLFTGMRFVHSFMPWRVQKTPPFCRECNDKGQYKVFLKSGPNDDGWRVCNCKDKISQEIQNGTSPSTCSCDVCLDQRTIGKDRPCPHCYRRGLFVAHAQVSVERAKIKDPLICRGCGCEKDTYDVELVDGLWFCKNCLQKAENFKKENQPFIKSGESFPDPYKAIKHKDVWCPECCHRQFYDNHIAENPSAGSQKKSPLSYLDGEGEDSFCGDPTRKNECKNWLSIKEGLKKKQPTELHVGDTIVIRSIREGHRYGHCLGKLLRISGINLPFVAVEYDSSFNGGRNVNIVDLRGMELYGSRKSSLVRRTASYQPSALYQPLLEPSSLKVGDKFMVLRLYENDTVCIDSSWRGDAFRVTKTAHMPSPAANKSGRIPKGELAIETEQLSFPTGLSPILFACEGLQILSVNDQYVQATKTHCPDSV